MAGGDTNTETQSKSVAVKRFKLADFRYGREEMLALFSEAVKMPKALQDFGDVIVQETQCQPLSFIPMTEEEEVEQSLENLFVYQALFLIACQKI